MQDPHIVFARTAFARTAARHAIRALYAEVSLEPKPGLVSLRDSGSHTDMTAATFVRSLFALRHYFCDITAAGMQGVPLATLQALGMRAEARMLRATGGINTHRGVVFALGLLCAAAGRLHASGLALEPRALRQTLHSHWGDALRSHALHVAARVPVSHGQKVVRTYGLRSAVDEAADAMPTLFETTLPALQCALAQGHAPRPARVQALFATMAVLDDTNVVHRGGLEGLAWLKAQSAAFLGAGGVSQNNWIDAARVLHAQCVARRLSPGGAADVLASACWVHAMQSDAAYSRTNAGALEVA